MVEKLAYNLSIMIPSPVPYAPMLLLFLSSSLSHLKPRVVYQLVSYYPSVYALAYRVHKLGICVAWVTFPSKWFYYV